MGSHAHAPTDPQRSCCSNIRGIARCRSGNQTMGAGLGGGCGMRASQVTPPCFRFSYYSSSVCMYSIHHITCKAVRSCTLTCTCTAVLFILVQSFLELPAGLSDCFLAACIRLRLAPESVKYRVQILESCVSLASWLFLIPLLGILL